MLHRLKLANVGPLRLMQLGRGIVYARVHGGELFYNLDGRVNGIQWLSRFQGFDPSGAPNYIFLIQQLTFNLINFNGNKRDPTTHI